MPRTFELITPLGPDVLLFHRMSAREELSRLSDIELDVLSSKGDINLDQILAKNVTVKVELPDDKIRYFNGFVSRFTQVGMRGRYHLYRAKVSPWLWFLTRRANCRIFQQMTVPDIIKKVFADYPGLADSKFELTASYHKWDYCVQYRETDFNFISRLMEQEGIYYYFKHKEGQHTLVVCDSYSAHAAFTGYAQIPFIPQDRMTRPEQERISDWNFTREVQPGRYMIDDYDFERPSVELQVKNKIKREHPHADYEVFDWPGEYIQTADGDHYVQARIEELHAQFELAYGRTNARGVNVGHLFKLIGQTRNDQNREYLVVATQHHLQFSEYESMPEEGTSFECGFTVLNSRQPFRAARTTPKPTVQGPQTAVVVGPGGDEIYTDKYGRVKVQFHWDRVGEKNENSSCWIRVSHPWAGKNWGFIAIPRIGQEVIVDFIEGDPDQPIITGRVYNAEQMPPWALPANMTQTGILTRSSKGGSGANANELRFEDKKGAEQVYLHAEKNQDIEVENDETHWVGHDRKKTIDNDETSHIKHDRTETVDNDETITIHGNRTEEVDKDEDITIHGNRTEEVDKEESITIHGGRTEEVDKDESITIHGSRTEQVDKNETITIDGARTETVAKDETITINGGRTETVAKDETITINGGRTETVAKDESITINGGRTETVAKDESVTISQGRTVSVSKDDSLSVGKNLKIDAGDSITITTGSASITMKKDGTITIKGKDITVDGSGKINVKASSDIVMKGSKILQN